VAVRIELEPCINCGLCRRHCPTDAIHYFTTQHRTHVVEPAACIDCDLCVKVCPAFCIVPDEAYVHDPAEREAAKAKARAWAAKQNQVKARLRARAGAAISALGAR
jgi:formate hydrogenlyase subunit 6/NADH:ubiquinone oxidoreductase subunit I